MNVHLTTPRIPITPPPDFPVAWERPEDAEYHWTRDREHCPQPITPMFSSVAELTAGAGRQPTVEHYAEAILGRRDLTINSYDYTRVIPFQGTPQELAERTQRNRQKLLDTTLHLQELWENEWRPELESHWDFWAQFDLPGADLPALAAHLEESLARATRIYEIHYLMGPPMWFAIDEFEKFYCDLFPTATPLDAQRLLQGFDNKTLQIGRSLWQLSRWAAASPGVRRVLEQIPAEQVMPALGELVEGRAFLVELDTFLRTYGRRSSLWDWGYPSWEDDPTPVINNLKLYLAQPERDLEAELAQAAAERQAAIQQARQALALYPAAVMERFETLLRSAQIALVLTEDHTYYIDFNGFGWLHRVIYEAGRRLAADGRLRSAGDAYYLTIQELRWALADPLFNPFDLAAGRRAEAERWAQIPEPLELGTRPAAPLQLYSPDARRMAHYLGGYVAEDAPASSPDEPGLLRGQPGSSGVVIGQARVILSLAQAHRLQMGDILVTTTTAPPWTPLFLTAGGLVTDAGGLLSHGAVVSREYRIPAVVGTRRATQTILDGQWLEVDGDRGIVRFLDEAEVAQRRLA